jgi:hypothetical protein
MAVSKTVIVDIAGRNEAEVDDLIAQLARACADIANSAASDEAHLIVTEQPVPQ